MKKVMLMLSLLIVVNLFADKYAGEIFQINISPRNTAIGGCGLTDTATLSPAYWNSALLRDIPNQKFEFMHAEEYSGLLTFDSFSATYGKINKFAVTITRIGIDDIPITKLIYPDDSLSQENRPYKYKSINNSDLVAYIGFVRMFRGFVLGITPKIAYRNLGDISGYGFGADISTMFKLNQKFDVAIKIRDFFTTQVLWSNGTYEFVNPSLDYEFAYQTLLPMIKKPIKIFLRNEIHPEVLASDFSLEGLDFHLGTALQLHPSFDFFAGFNEKNLTTGMSFDWKNWLINYSFEHNTELDNSHRISLGYIL